MVEEALFVPSPRALPLEALRERLEAFVVRLEPGDARQAAWALEELMGRTPRPVAFREDLLLWSGKVLALVLVEPLGALEGFLLGSFLHARYAHPSPLGLLLVHERGQAYLEELTRRTREAVPELPEGLFPRWFQLGLLRFVEDHFGYVRFVQTPFGLLRVDRAGSPLTWKDVQRSGERGLARALWRKSGEVLPPRPFLRLLRGEELSERELSEGRKPLALAGLARV